jgi:hypothetical protein
MHGAKAAVAIVVLLGVMAHGSASRASTLDLSRVADRNTPIPGGAGNFTTFNSPVLSGDETAFLGVGGSGQEGIYLFAEDVLVRVADLATSIPGDGGVFTLLNNPVLSEGHVAFRGAGAGQQGIYLFDGEALTRVADRNTAIPEGLGNFTAFNNPALSGSAVAFRGVGDGQEGIYLFEGGMLHRLADRDTSVPEGTGTFTAFGNPVLSGGRVAFLGFATGQQGVYLYDGGMLARVADLATPIPGGTGNFTAFGTPLLSGSALAFLGSGAGQQGIYLFDGEALTRVADLDTLIPEGVGEFGSLLGPALSGNDVAFVGSGGSGQQGIYRFHAGMLARVADRNTPIPEGAGTFSSFSTPALSGSRVAFRAFGVLQQGVYLFDGKTLGRAADRNTPIPEGVGNFTGFFFDPVVSESKVAFSGVGASQDGIYLATQPGLTALGPARLWLGLRRDGADHAPFDLEVFDVQVALYKNDSLVASGLRRCVGGLAGGPDGAREVQVAFDPFDPVPLLAGDVLSLRVLARVGTDADGVRCTGPEAAQATSTSLRLYYDAPSHASGFDATIGGDTGTLFLRSDGGACAMPESQGVTMRVLDATAPADGTSKCLDSGNARFAGGNPWLEIGTWSAPPLP